MSIILKSTKCHISLSSSPKVDIFDEVLKRLETIKCTEIETRVISYGMIFRGFYQEVRFEFNIYVNARGHMNRKTRQNPVWHKPIKPPDMLKDAINEVVQWVKGIEMGM